MSKYKIVTKEEPNRILNCITNSHSSRICERGTKSCIVEHKTINDIERCTEVQISSKYPTGPGNAITKEMLQDFKTKATGEKNKDD